MNSLRVGFARVNVDPPLGIPVRGYYVERYASAILDHLHINMLAYECGEGEEKTVTEYNPDTGRYEERKTARHDNAVLMACIDNCGLKTEQCDMYRGVISEATGVPMDRIYIHSDHTHTAPSTMRESFEGEKLELIDKYLELLKVRFADAATEALSDLKPAKMGYCVGRAPERVAYIRRYKMKDGSTMTCPPINDPNIDHPIGELDQRVNVIRFDREGAETIVIMNYGLHADTLNLDKISPDFPGELARAFEAAIPEARIVTFVGAQGDVGSTHVFPEGGDMNDTLISFDNEMKSPGMCRFVGRALAGSVLQVYDKVEYVDVDSVNAAVKYIRIPANVPPKEAMPLAHRYKDLHDAGRDSEIPYTAMELTTVVAEATRMCNLENGPEYFEFPLTGVAIGPVAFLGIPGEPFTEVGRQIKTADGWKLVCPTINTNGKEGYFPTKDAFDEGGYEARSSRFKSGVAEKIIEEGKALLDELRS
ncbi:MAG: hypothetical protein Q4B67_10180 [Eubacteriales bacterium]|nr:hypothetical protein [Eubacteriales bacterium]